jgi:hypothetical protein
MHQSISAACFNRVLESLFSRRQEDSKHANRTSWEHSSWTLLLLTGVPRPVRLPTRQQCRKKPLLLPHAVARSYPLVSKDFVLEPGTVALYVVLRPSCPVQVESLQGSERH